MLVSQCRCAQSSSAPRAHDPRHRPRCGRVAAARADQEPVDLAVAMHWLGGDRRLLLELVSIFMDDSPKRLVSLRAAMSTSDIVQVEQLAHSLKGSAAILGAADLQSAARVLEDAAHDLHSEDGQRKVARISPERAEAIEICPCTRW